MPAKSFAIIAAFLAMVPVATAQLPPGNYTIDPALPAGGNNFQTWATAVSALSSGVSGPGQITFTVASVTFNEAVTIPPISGTGPSTTVTFVAVGLPAIINAGGQPSALEIQNTQSYLTFENLELRNWAQYGLNLAGSSTTYCSFCTFRKITVDGPPATSSTVYALRGYYGRDCNFEDCRFLGGGYTVRTEQIQRNKFRRCEFDGKGTASRILAPYNNNDADNLWENCFFHDCSPTGNGLHIDVSSYGNMFWHNTILVNTSGIGVRLGALTGWSRANSFRNNIVVNLGTGLCVMYGVSSSGLLECNDLDHNVYYAPLGNAVGMQSGGFPSGSLAAWKTFFANNLSLVPPGGGMSWDPNSIEADPGLMSLSPPYDIHLATGSICVDAGTTTYVAGPWITYPPGSSVTDDFEGDARPATGVDIGADEVACAMIDFETNSPGSSMDVDGIQGSPCSPAVTVRAQGTPGVLNAMSTNVGLGWEAALAVAPILPASGGAITTANGQILNIDFSASVVFLNGGTLPFFGNPFPGNFIANFIAPPGPFTASIQMVNFDPTNPDGFSISQPCQLDVP